MHSRSLRVSFMSVLLSPRRFVLGSSPQIVGCLRVLEPSSGKFPSNFALLINAAYNKLAFGDLRKVFSL